MFLFLCLALCMIGPLVWIFGARLVRLAFALGAFLLAALPAAAAPLDAFITAATPGLIELLGAALTMLIGWAANTARKRWNLEIEARHREALHSAILSGAQLALAGKLDAQAAIQLILQHVRNSVPDAVIALQPSAEVLENLARAKLQEAAQAVPQVIGLDAISAGLSAHAARRR